MNSPVEESMQVEVSEGATAPQSIQPGVQLASSLPPLDLSFLGAGPIPFLPPRNEYQLRADISDWEDEDSQSDLEPQRVENRVIQTTEVIQTGPKVRKAKIYPRLPRTPSTDRLLGVKPKSVKRTRSAERTASAHRELPHRTALSDDEGSSGSIRAKAVKRRDVTKEAFLTYQQQVKSLTVQLEELPQPRKGDKKSKKEYKAQYKILQAELDKKRRECESLKNQLFYTEQTAHNLLLNQKLSFIEKSNSEFQKNKAEANDLYTRLDFSEQQRKALEDNYTAFQNVLGQHFHEEWSKLEETVNRRTTRLNAKLKDRDDHIKYQNKELKKLELEVGKLQLNLNSCSTKYEELANYKLTAKTEFDALRTVSNNRQAEIEFLKKNKLDLEQTIKDRDNVILQWNNTCSNITAENKELNNRIAKGISACEVHAELVAAANSELEKARAEYKKSLDSNLTLEKDIEGQKQKINFASQQYAVKVTEVDDLIAQISERDKEITELQKESTKFIQQISSLEKSKTELNLRILNLTTEGNNLRKKNADSSNIISAQHKEISHLRSFHQTLERKPSTIPPEVQHPPQQGVKNSAQDSFTLPSAPFTFSGHPQPTIPPFVATSAVKQPQQVSSIEATSHIFAKQQVDKTSSQQIPDITLFGAASTFLPRNQFPADEGQRIPDRTLLENKFVPPTIQPRSGSRVLLQQSVPTTSAIPPSDQTGAFGQQIPSHQQAVSQPSHQDDTLLNNFHSSESTSTEENNSERMASRNRSQNADQYTVSQAYLNNISLFFGQQEEQSIKDWLKECEMYAIIYNWPEAKRKEIFATRLRGDALLWHYDRMRSYPTESYSDWVAQIKEEFTSPEDFENQQMKFYTMKQTPNQPVEKFIERIESTYQELFGNADNSPWQDPNSQSVRDVTALQVFMQGVLPNVKEVMKSNNLLLEYRWDKVKEAAKIADKILKAQKRMTAPTINSISSEAQELLNIQAKALEEVNKKLSEISSQQEASKLQVEGVVNNISYRRGGGRGRFSNHRGRGNYQNTGHNNRTYYNKATNGQRTNSNRGRGGANYSGNSNTQKGQKKAETGNAPEQSNGEKPKRFEGKCHHCQAPGHMIKNCWKLHGKPNKEQSQQ